MSMHTPNSFRDLSMIPIPRAQRLAAKKAALPASPGQTPGGYHPPGNSGSEAEHREEIRSYRIGRRPLLSGPELSEVLFKHVFHDTRTRVRFEHQQFVGPDKSNFGMGWGGKLFDDTANLDKYAYDTPEYGQTRYNAEIIDQAREELDREWEEKKAIHKQRRQYRGSESRPDADSLRYNFPLNNCQDYVALVLERADRIAQKKGVNLILEDKPDRNTPSGKNARTSKQLSEEIDPGKILYPDMR